MPPADTNNTPAPTPPKEGFLSKLTGLFKKKAVIPPPTDPQRTSLTPEPRLENGPADTAAPESVPTEQPDPMTPSQPSVDMDGAPVTPQASPEADATDLTSPVASQPVSEVQPVPQPTMQPGPQPSPFDAPQPAQEPVGLPVSPVVADPVAPTATPATPGVPQMPPMPERPQSGQPPIPPAQ